MSGAVRLLPPLEEWTSVEHAIGLSEADRAATRALPRGRVEIDELRTGVRIRTRSWVGVVRLPTLEIRIVPKLSGEHLGLVRLIEFASGVGALGRLPGDVAIRVGNGSLLDLLALLFTEACDEVVRKGLLSGYLRQEDDIAYVRGRILVDQLMLRRLGRADRIPCRFDDLEHDIDENRILLAALVSLARFIRSDEVLIRVSRLRAILESVCQLDGFAPREVRLRLSYDRLNAHYRTAHDLAWLLLEGLGVDDLLTPVDVQSYAFLLDMNRLFEQFVRRLFEVVLPVPQYRVVAQRSFRSIVWNATAGESYSRVVPDLMVERPNDGSVLPVDAKYKKYGDGGVADKDIYQCFLYAYALSRMPQGGVPTAGLIYPSTSGEVERLQLDIRSKAHGSSAQLLVVGVPIPAVLDELAGGLAHSRLTTALVSAMGLDGVAPRRGAA